MDATAYDEGKAAVLRSDTPAPILRLWDETIEQDIAPEYADYAETMALHAQLSGEMCSSSISVSIDVDELVELVKAMRAISVLSTQECIWETTYRRISLRLSVQMGRMGPPVTCDIWLRDAITVQEEHHCRFETNLTWVNAFLSDLEHIAVRYRRARVYLE